MAGFPVRIVAGVDEVGRGCLFGPVVTAAVVLPSDVESLWKLKEYAWLKDVKDSKLLTPEERETLAPKIRNFVRSWCVAEASVLEIDTLNIHHATLLAMKRAVKGLSLPVEHVLVDGKFGIPGLSVPCTALVGGDARSLSIACASIVAKVHRDQSMLDLAIRYPGYGFESHKGYSTPEHKEALRRLGPTEHHRKSFEPVAQFLQPPLF
jgi:ribonuclease HII